MWCGPNAIVVLKGDPGGEDGERDGLFWVDLETSRHVRISAYRGARPDTCSPGGEWLLFRERNDDLLAFEVSRQRRVTVLKDFFAHEGDTVARFSPSGRVLLLQGKRVQASASVPTRRMPWAIVWLLAPRHVSQAVWVEDSRRILFSYRDEQAARNRLATKAVEPLEGSFVVMSLRGVDSLSEIRRAGDGVVFGKGRIRDGDALQPGETFLVRCDVEAALVNCRRTLTNEPFPAAFDVTPDGSRLVFLRKGDPCLWFAVSPSYSARCLRTDAYYYPLISPDGTRIATFRPSRKDDSTAVGAADFELIVSSAPVK